ncbi:hypothetical protein C943_04474 [Mariniradius saccharolyticus AK6]|uniref:Prevent-host-death protein n=1 Tax=Mariniradius saccharolyticus AK6 TaxID=1239962 RepID=M7X857_9BACT|nr:hypothetical protein [Mariniradius saccharolyticus]EMS33595.1 hypothetical protein C943_04474 [Mariniradius saccharolyticus AK6]
MTLTMHIGEFKARFSEVVELVREGAVIKVVKGKSSELVGYFGVSNKPEKTSTRKLGFFNDQDVVIKKEDMQWTDEELSEMGL